MINNSIIFVQTATSTVQNSTTEGSLIGSGTGGLTIPASYIKAGMAIRAKLRGTYQCGSGVEGVTIKCKFGSTVIASVSISKATHSGVCNFDVDYLSTVATAGASGNISLQGTVSIGLDTSDPVTYPQVFYPLSSYLTNGVDYTTIDWTSSRLIDIRAVWSVANGGNIIKGVNSIVELHNRA
jgi:hypothetical protein